MIYGQPITLGGGSAAPKIFGDGSDGVGLFTSNTTWNADTEDTGMIIKNFESLTISEGVTVAAGNRNCGMIIRVKGDCVINGTLANRMAPKTLLDSDEVDFSMWPTTLLAGTAGAGGAGGAGSTSNYGSGGAGGAGQPGRLYGGGYSGGGGGGAGGLGGNGGAGGSAVNITTAIASIFVGGVDTGSTSLEAGRGRAPGSYGGGGAGTGTTSGNYPQYYSGASGAGASAANFSVKTIAPGGGAGNIGGGVIILFVGGKLTVTGTIDCSGNAGGNGGKNSYHSQPYGGGGAGGGGGGRIFICHKGDISNTGTLNVNGGAAGAAGCDGNYPSYAGTAGSIGTTAVKTYKQYMEEDVA